MKATKDSNALVTRVLRVLRVLRFFYIGFALIAHRVFVAVIALFLASVLSSLKKADSAH